MRIGRIKGRGFKIAAAAAVATLVGVGTALHASADVEVAEGSGGSGTIVDTVCQTGHCLQVDIEFAGANVGNNEQEFFTCVAQAWPDASATALLACNLKNTSGSNSYNAPIAANPPGPLAVAEDGPDAFPVGTGGPLEVCYEAAAIFTDNLIGAPLMLTNNGQVKCTEVQLVG